MNEFSIKEGSLMTNGIMFVSVAKLVHLKFPQI